MAHNCQPNKDNNWEQSVSGFSVAVASWFLVMWDAMSTRESEDLARLDRLAFRRREKCGDLVRRFRRLPATARRHPDFGFVEQVYAWLLVPYSLWPIDVHGLLELLMGTICAAQRVTDEMRLLAGLLSELPSTTEQDAVAAQERDVQVGSYEGLISAQHKFDLKEEMLSQKPDFKDDWQLLKKSFAVDKYRDKKGILRRRMASERNFRPEGWQFRWKTGEDRFRVVFDAFCHKWVLYGMEGERPLLLKLSVNVTPFGTMILIPRYWSFDHKRDLKWKAVARLHRSRDVHRQGVKLSASQLARYEDGMKALRLWRQAKSAGLKGVALTSWVMGKLGWDPRTDERQLRRLLRELKPR